VRERWRRRRASREQITRRRGCRWVVRSHDNVATTDLCSPPQVRRAAGGPPLTKAFPSDSRAYSDPGVGCKCG
jgi:hypothetical protein